MPRFLPDSDTISITIKSEESGCVVTFMQSGENIDGELQMLGYGATSAIEAGWQQGLDLMAAT